MNISDLGLEIFYEPITDVRLRFQSGKWLIEYRRKPRYYFDKWWWFDDGLYHDYNDAYVRAQILAAEGGVKRTRPKQQQFKANTVISK